MLLTTRFNRKEVEGKIQELAEALAVEKGYEVVDLELVREAGAWFLRLFIDRPGGVTLDDCELVNRALSDKLDEVDLIPVNYYLEVSSPGLDRPLKKDSDFERFRGHQVEVKTFAAIGGRKVFRGELQGLKDGQVLLVIDGSQPVALPKAGIASARLRPDF